jgi:hypothetical protein
MEGKFHKMQLRLKDRFSNHCWHWKKFRFKQQKRKNNYHEFLILNSLVFNLISDTFVAISSGENHWQTKADQLAAIKTAQSLFFSKANWH